MPERTLVTGPLGCIDAWTIKALLDEGEDPVGYDLGADDPRLTLVLDEEELACVMLVRGDIVDADALGRALGEVGITGVVHLAALHVFFCRADLALGVLVNVMGTVALDARKGLPRADPRRRLRELASPPTCHRMRM